MVVVNDTFDGGLWDKTISGNDFGFSDWLNRNELTFLIGLFPIGTDSDWSDPYVGGWWSFYTMSCDWLLDLWLVECDWIKIFLLVGLIWKIIAENMEK